MNQIQVDEVWLNAVPLDLALHDCVNRAIKKGENTITQHLKADDFEVYRGLSSDLEPIEIYPNPNYEEISYLDGSPIREPSKYVKLTPTELKESIGLFTEAYNCFSFTLWKKTP